MDSDLEKANHTVQAYDDLMRKGEKEEAQALFKDTLDTSAETPLGLEWLPVIRRMDSGYAQLQQFLRILSFDPNREQTYKEISELLESAPESFNSEKRHDYLETLNSIDGVNHKWLRKFNLNLAAPHAAST